jgi:peptidyl-prolyl cis-trans isomerase SurA
MMGSLRTLGIFATLTLAVAMSPLALPQPAVAAEVKAVVNGTPITNTDVQRRAAFIRLQQRKGNATQIATEEMIEQVLRLQEAKRLRIQITDKQVGDAYATFAKSNGMTSAQMDQILGQAGVTKGHFREYIRGQMAWGQALGARQRGVGNNELNDAVRQLFKKGGTKASATEYVLEQVVLVIPERDRRALMGKRKREAAELRSRYAGCNNSKDLVRGMVDVTIRSLGRVLEPELPPEWEKAVKATAPGKATVAIETPRGVEFIGVCSTRVTNDDRVTELMVMQEQAKSGEGAEDASKKYTEELRKRARIVMQ